MSGAHRLAFDLRRGEMYVRCNSSYVAANCLIEWRPFAGYISYPVSNRENVECFERVVVPAVNI